MGLQEEQVPAEKWGLRLLKGGREHILRPGRAAQAEREQVRRKGKGLTGSRPAPPRALTLRDPLPDPARTEAWPGVPRGARGRRDAVRSSPAMCWRRASSRCVDSTSPMARRSRGRIRPRYSDGRRWRHGVRRPHSRRPAAPQSRSRLGSAPLPPRSPPRPACPPAAVVSPAGAQAPLPAPPRPARPGHAPDRATPSSPVQGGRGPLAAGRLRQREDPRKGDPGPTRRVCAKFR